MKCPGLQAPEIQTMYSLNMPVSAIRTKIRQEFERHRYVSQLKTADVLLFNSHQEFQVRDPIDKRRILMKGWETGRSQRQEQTRKGQADGEMQETLNFWKQLSHVMKYFRAEEDPKARLPKNFMQGFIEVNQHASCP